MIFWFLTFEGVPFRLVWLQASPASNRFFLEATGAETHGMSTTAGLVIFASLEEIWNTLGQSDSVSQSDKLFRRKYCKCNNRLSQEILFNHKYKSSDPLVYMLPETGLIAVNNALTKRLFLNQALDTKIRSYCAHFD